MTGSQFFACFFFTPTIYRKTGFIFRKDTSHIKTGSEKKAREEKKQETKANSKS